MTPLQEKRREQIIKAAISVFKESGFHGGTIENIAIKAGIGKGTVYEYFNSKQEIFEQMILYIMRYYLISAKKSIEGIESLQERLLALLDFDAEFIEYDGNLIEKSIYSLENASEEFKKNIMELHQELYEFILNIIIEAKESGEVKEDCNEVMIALIFINVIGDINKNKRIFTDNLKLKHEELIHMLFNGIG